MSDVRKYRKKLAIGPRLVEVLELACRARLALLVEGETGIGKSEIVREAARQMGIQFVALDLSLLEPVDLLGMPYVEDGATRYAPPGILPRVGAGILLLEELNRAEQAVQAPALQLLTDRSLHDYRLPDGWIVCAAINPANGDYAVNKLDPAMLDRFVVLEVVADLPSWIAWAREHDVTPGVLRLAERDEGFFADVSPRRWTYVSKLVASMSENQLDDRDFVEATLGGLLPPAWVQLLLEENARYGSESYVDPRQLLLPDDDARTARAVLKRLVQEGRMDSLQRLYAALYQIVSDAELGTAAERGEITLASLEKAMALLPGDLRENLQRAFGANPQAARLLGLAPDEILSRYPRNRRRSVRAWRGRADRHHRSMALATAMRHRLGGADAARQLEDAQRRRVQELVEDLGPEFGGELESDLEQVFF